MSKLLVTGAAGFIGANFVHYWHGANPDDTIVALDCLSYAGNKHNLAILVEWFQINDPTLLDPTQAKGLGGEKI